MKEVIIVKILTAVILICGVAGPDMAQSGNTARDNRPKDLLERQVPGYNLERLTTFSAYSSALAFTLSPGGIVRIGSCSEEPTTYTWRPAGSKLRETLDSIVVADPRYRWELVDGVINVLPVAGEPAFLTTRIGELEVRNATSANWPLGKLQALPEVKRAMRDLGLRWGVTLFVSGQPPHPADFSVRCKDVTLREALNAIARAQGIAVWDYVETHCDGIDEVIIRF
jgi:hypothetical protein